MIASRGSCANCGCLLVVIGRFEASDFNRLTGNLRIAFLSLLEMDGSGLEVGVWEEVVAGIVAVDDVIGAYSN